MFPSFLSVLLVLVTWKILTGGIHLDGLADCLDGLAGRDPAERLAIMRDSRIGVFGALGLVVVLLLSLDGLTEVDPAVRTRALVLAPAVGRATPLLLARVFTPATPREGSGAAFMAAVTRGALGIGLGVVALASAMIAGKWGLVVAVAGLALAGAAARFLSRRLGGLTGDGLGAAVEVGELGVLLAFAAFSHLRVV